MNVMKTVLWTVAGATLLSMFGCDLFLARQPRTERVYVEQRPVYVEQRPVYVEPPRREIIVERAPPPVLEVRVR